MSAYARTSSPHIHDRETTAGIMGKVIVALLPSVFAAVFYHGFDAVRLLAIVLITAWVAEFAVGNLSGRTGIFRTESTIVTALLLGFMLPPAMPSWVAGLGVLSALLLGKELFGGLGTNLFNPALLGWVVLQTVFPGLMQQPLMIQPSGLPDFFPVTCLAGGLFLVLQKIIHWEIPVLYLLVLAAGEKFSGVLPFGGLSGGAFLAAFFIITEPVTAPMTRAGHRYFAVGSAALVFCLPGVSSHWGKICFAVLMMNALTPWIDRWMSFGHRSRTAA